MISSDEKGLVTVPAGALYFLGSFKYKVLYRNLGEILKLTPEQYGLIKVKNTDEAAVLKMLLENVKDAGWKKRIQARLSQIAR